MNDFLATVPFDLYELNLFHLVARARSFTRAARQAGLTQSAITRQIQGMESRLGAALFDRTTRQVDLTAAGKRFLERSGPILASANDLLNEMQEEFRLAPRVLRVGVARSIGLAYLPGYFFAFRRKHPGVQLQIVQRASREILAALETREIDAGLLCPPARLPRGLQITHHFTDEFTAIAPRDASAPAGSKSMEIKKLKALFADKPWLLIEREGNTGKLLHQWLGRRKCAIEPGMELDSFDAIVNLVSLGLGVSLVPHRVLPLYRGRAIRRIGLQPRFSRHLAVVVRKTRQLPKTLAAFVENVLF